MKRTRAALFTLLFVSFAYFYQAGGWNQNSRFALVRAITNEHTLNIDPFSNATGDKAFFDGHYYSDKAPGLALAAVPAIAVVRPVLHAVGGDPLRNNAYVFAHNGFLGYPVGKKIDLPQDWNPKLSAARTI